MCYTYFEGLSWDKTPVEYVYICVVKGLVTAALRNVQYYHRYSHVIRRLAGDDGVQQKYVQYNHVNGGYCVRESVVVNSTNTFLNQ